MICCILCFRNPVIGTEYVEYIIQVSSNFTTWIWFQSKSRGYLDLLGILEWNSELIQPHLHRLINPNLQLIHDEQHWVLVLFKIKGPEYTTYLMEYSMLFLSNIGLLFLIDYPKKIVLQSPSIWKASTIRAVHGHFSRMDLDREPSPVFVEPLAVRFLLLMSPSLIKKMAKN